MERIDPPPAGRGAGKVSGSSRVRAQYGQALEGRVVRKRRRLYTQEELGALLGVSARTVRALERRPVSSLLLGYLHAVGYRLTFTPKRKGNA